MKIQGCLVLLNLLALIWGCAGTDPSGGPKSPSLQDPVPDRVSDSLPKTRHFKFKKRRINGRDVAVVSFRLDTERGRRSVLAPKSEKAHRYLHTPSLLHYLPSFEGEPPEGRNRSGIPAFKRRERISPRHKHHRRFGSDVIGTNDDVMRVSNDVIGTYNDVIEKEILKEKEILEDLESSIRFGLNKIESFQVGASRGAAPFGQSSRGRHGRGRRKKRKKLRERNKRKRARKKKLKKERRRKKQNRRRKNTRKLFGNDACQYKKLKKCARKVGILPARKIHSSSDSEICSQRRNFLGCVERRQARSICSDDVTAKGNLDSLRSRIKDVFVTTNSCLLSESLK